ncbi:amidohydrolase family protein [Roseococcus sp. SYP-B2431]|uniref:amidohydrolase family protein n=1 Tax=Roseococcus sp. SYP-B2431 TaxID=2496640 RepID=UPI001F100C14|nr:amidohydrolase family protein [Roseococcus sp. SYP-B2431]
MILEHVRPLGGAPVDVHVAGGRIAKLTPSTREGAAAILLPGLVEGHCHLDKTLWGRPWWRNEVGPLLRHRIENEKAVRKALGMDAAREGRALCLAHLAAGTTRLRSHVDVDEESRLGHVEKLLELRESLRGVMDIQLVAFPQSGLLRTPGAEEWMEEALRLGCDVVGGLDPSVIDRDPVKHLDIVFKLAERHGKPVDIHLHEPHELGAFSMELIAERTRAIGAQGRVTISHGFALGDVPAPRADALLAMLAEAGVAVCTSAPPSRATPPLRRARELGVTLFAGNDNIRDTWNPYNAPDMLARAAMVGLKYELRRDEEVEWALAAVTIEAAKGCGFAGYGLEAGAQADLVVVEAESLAEAVVTRKPPKLVVSNGREVARDGVARVIA